MDEQLMKKAEQIKCCKPPREIAYLKMLLRSCNRKPASPGNGFAKMKIEQRLAELEDK